MPNFAGAVRQLEEEREQITVIVELLEYHYGLGANSGWGPSDVAYHLHYINYTLYGFWRHLPLLIQAWVLAKKFLPANVRPLLPEMIFVDLDYSEMDQLEELERMLDISFFPWQTIRDRFAWVAYSVCDDAAGLVIDLHKLRGTNG